MNGENKLMILILNLNYKKIMILIKLFFTLSCYIIHFIPFTIEI